MVDQDTKKTVPLTSPVKETPASVPKHRRQSFAGKINYQLFLYKIPTVNYKSAKFISQISIEIPITKLIHRKIHKNK